MKVEDIKDILSQLSRSNSMTAVVARNMQEANFVFRIMNTYNSDTSIKINKLNRVMSTKDSYLLVTYLDRNIFIGSQFSGIYVVDEEKFTIEELQLLYSKLRNNYLVPFYKSIAGCGNRHPTGFISRG